LALRRSVKQLADQRGSRQQVLEVVEHEQRLARRQPTSDCLSRPLALGDHYLERAGKRRLDLLGGLKRGERDKPPPIAPPRPDHGGDLDSQPRLPRPAGTGQRHQPDLVVSQQLRDRRALRLPADRPRQRGRQASGRGRPAQRVGFASDRRALGVWRRLADRNGLRDRSQLEDVLRPR
jgi:hypothetical protein